MTHTSKLNLNHKSTKALKRSLRLEVLETRQMLSALGLTDAPLGGASEEAPAVTAPIEPTDPLLVTTSNDVVDAEDGLTSLREALDAAQDGDKIQFADGIDYVGISSNLTTSKEVTLSGAVTISVNYETLLTATNLTFDGLRLENYGFTMIGTSTFTGEYENTNCIVFNGTGYSEDLFDGSGMLMNEVNFKGITITNTTEYGEEYLGGFSNDYRVGGNYGDDYGFGDSQFVSILWNTGDMALTSVTIEGNALETNTDRSDNSTVFTAINNDQNGILFMNGVLIDGNSLTANTQRGDVSATFVGILNQEHIIQATDIMIFGNSAKFSFDERFDVEAFSDVFGIATGMRDLSNVAGAHPEELDVTLNNSTILEKIAAYRADVTMTNSIYLADDSAMERGFLLNGSHNLLVNDLSELEAIFPAYDAETNTFAGNDFRMWADSVIVDTGDNEFAESVSPNFNPIDLVGNNRINNETVDVGAVESTVEKLTIDGLEAVPADGNAGMTTVNFSWDATENATGYRLRYYTGTEKSTFNESDWSEIILLDAATLTHTLSGLAPGTFVAFQVQAIGDNLSYSDSDWADPASCVTKTQFDAPTPFIASLEKPLSIDLSWQLVAGASTNPEDVPYTIEYCVKPESGDPAADAWKALPNTYTLNVYGVLRVTNSQDPAAEKVLDYNTTYLFRIKANGVENHTDSDYSYAEKKTGARLVAPELSFADRTDTTITVQWTDNVNQPSQVKTYKLQYRAKNAANEAEWQTLTVPAGTTQATVNDLLPTTLYEFRIMVEGQKVKNQPDKMAEDSDWSDLAEASTKTKLGTPDPAAEAVSASKIDVTWNAVPNANKYQVVLKDTDHNFLSSQEVTGTSVTFEDLDPETTFIIEVTAIGEGEFVNSDAGTTEATTWVKLTAPTLTLDGRTTNSVTVKWDAVENSNGYEIQFKLLNGEWQTLTNSNLKATFTEDGVVIEDIDEVRGVWFRIKALGEDGISESSDWCDPVFESSTLGQLVLERGDLTADGTSTTTIKADWPVVTGASGYALSYRVSGSSAAWSTANIAFDGNSAIISGLTQNTNYEFQLIAKGDGTQNVDSNAVSATASTWIQLAPPVLNGALTTTTSSISGNLSSVDYAVGFQVEVSSDGENWTAATVDFANRTFTATGLTSLTNYQIRVKSNGTNAPTDGRDWVSVDSGWSVLPTAATTKIELAKPVLNITNLTPNSGTLTWNAITNAATYRLIVMEGTTPIFNGLVNGTSKDLNLSPNRSYTATVQALNPGENYINSEVSDPCTFQTAKGQLGSVTLTASFNGSNDAIQTSWNAVSGATGYTLEYRVKGTTAWTNSESLSASTTTFSLDEWDASTTYEFRVTAEADSDNIDSVSNIAEVTTPTQIDLSAVVLREPSANDLTEVPTTEKWVDEWTDVYVELWVRDAESLVDGRYFTFEVEFAGMYDLASTTSADGITLERVAGSNTRWQVTVDGYEGGTGADMLVRLKLTVNTSNGVNWTDRVNENAFKFDGEAIDTDVYAIPGDMNDDGTITMGQYDADDAKFQGEMGKTNSWADFDQDGDVDLYDRQWMIDNNYGKTWNGEDDVIYPDGAETPFKYSPVGTQAAPVLNPAGAAALEEFPEVAEATVRFFDDPEYAIALATASGEANEIPVVVDANSMSANGISAEEGKLFTKRTSEEKAEAGKADEAKVLDQIFAELEKEFDFFA